MAKALNGWQKTSRSKEIHYEATVDRAPSNRRDTADYKFCHDRLAVDRLLDEKAERLNDKEVWDE